MFGQRLGEKEKHIKRTVQAYEDKAFGIIDKLTLFSWDKFEGLYYTNRAAKDRLDAAFSNYATAL